MAASNITKQALATALRELMQEEPFDKIQVAQICERCDMNRKSFYYHFKDKYDLVNWIFDTEFIMLAMEAANEMPADDRWGLIERACKCFHENRNFYRKALKINGQNSFSDHLQEYCFPLMKLRVAHLISDEAAEDFTVNFFTDAVICAIERWLLDKECMPPVQFVSKLKRIVEGSAAAIYNEMNLTE
ncbi:MAG: hypothetical protein PWR12_1437 [Eubacteriaceae bacterium]|nr:hypothetical protein [Eubacteriaceae bacterium]MDK2935882.1 hypothetical protein [Eubacteriaceae bacterium]MDK2961657.1 hypothetical protein [Eubacteriaceae bacterium]